jgi:CheY-like chemotaxis protein
MQTVPSILYIEDMGEEAKRMQSILKRLPSNVDLAATGDEAIRLIINKAAQQSVYDLVLLDKRVPRTAGEAVDENFASAAQSTIQTLFGLVPIIIFTAFPSYPDCIDAIRAGAVNYIPKTDPLTSANNTEYLFNCCKKLLYPESTKTEDPITRWFQSNLSLLIEKFSGKVVAVIEPEYAKRIKVAEIIADYGVLSAVSVTELRSILFHNQLLGWAKTRFIEIPTNVVR